MIERAVKEQLVEELAQKVRQLQRDAETLLQNVKTDEDFEAIEIELAATAYQLPTHPPYPADKKRPAPKSIELYSEAVTDLRKRFSSGKKKRKD